MTAEKNAQSPVRAGSKAGTPPGPARQDHGFYSIERLLRDLSRLQSRAAQREIEAGEVLGEAEPETPERNGIGGTFGPGGGR